MLAWYIVKYDLGPILTCKLQNTKMGSARTSQLAKVRPQIASHTLVYSSHLPKKHSYVLSKPSRLLGRGDYRQKMW